MAEEINNPVDPVKVYKLFQKVKDTYGLADTNYGKFKKNISDPSQQKEFEGMFNSDFSGKEKDEILNTYHDIVKKKAEPSKYVSHLPQDRSSYPSSDKTLGEIGVHIPTEPTENVEVPYKPKPSTLGDYLKYNGATLSDLHLPVKSNLDRVLSPDEKGLFDNKLSLTRTHQDKFKLDNENEARDEFFAPVSGVVSMVRGMNKESIDLLKATNGAERLVSDAVKKVTGGRVDLGTGVCDKIANYINDNAVKNLPSTPNNILDNVYDQLGSMGMFVPASLLTPEVTIGTLSKATGGVIRGVPKLLNFMGTTNALNKYQELSVSNPKHANKLAEAGRAFAMGAHDAVLLDGLGYMSGLTGGVVTAASKSKVLGLVSNAAMAAGLGGGMAAATEYAETGKVTPQNVASQATTFGVMGIAPVLAELSQNAIKTFNKTAAADINRICKIPVPIQDIREAQNDKFEEAQRETSPEAKRDNMNAAKILQGIGDIKYATKEIIDNPGEAVLSIKDDKTLTEEEKAYQIKKINIIVAANDPKSIAARPISNRIDDIKSQIEDVNNNKALDNNIKESKIKTLNEQLKESQTELYNIVSGKQYVEPIKKEEEYAAKEGDITGRGVSEYPGAAQGAAVPEDETKIRERESEQAGDRYRHEQEKGSAEKEVDDVVTEHLKRSNIDRNVADIPKDEKDDIYKQAMGVPRELKPDINSTAKEKRFRLGYPDDYDRDAFNHTDGKKTPFRRAEIEKGVSVVYGRVKGKLKAQALRFESNKFSDGQMKSWLSDNIGEKKEIKVFGKKMEISLTHLKPLKKEPFTIREKPGVVKEKITPEKVETAKVSELKTEPDYFQYKPGADKEGKIKEEVGGIPTKDKPITVWKEQNTVIEGHNKLAAAKEAGLEDVPIQYVSAATKEEALAKAAHENIQKGELEGLTKTEKGYVIDKTGTEIDDKGNIIRAEERAKKEAETTAKKADIEKRLASHKQALSDVLGDIASVKRLDNDEKYKSNLLRLHKALVDVAKDYIDKGMLSAEEFARTIGWKVQDVLDAWEEAKGEKKITKPEDLSYYHDKIDWNQKKRTVDEKDWGKQYEGDKALKTKLGRAFNEVKRDLAYQEAKATKGETPPDIKEARKKLLAIIHGNSEGIRQLSGANIERLVNKVNTMTLRNYEKTIDYIENISTKAETVSNIKQAEENQKNLKPQQLGSIDEQMLMRELKGMDISEMSPELLKDYIELTNRENLTKKGVPNFDNTKEFIDKHNEELIKLEYKDVVFGKQDINTPEEMSKAIDKVNDKIGAIKESGETTLAELNQVQRSLSYLNHKLERLSKTSQIGLDDYSEDYIAINNKLKDVVDKLNSEVFKNNISDFKKISDKVKTETLKQIVPQLNAIRDVINKTPDNYSQPVKDAVDEFRRNARYLSEGKEGYKNVMDELTPTDIINMKLVADQLDIDHDIPIIPKMLTDLNEKVAVKYNVDRFREEIIKDLEEKAKTNKEIGKVTSLDIEHILKHIQKNPVWAIDQYLGMRHQSPIWINTMGGISNAVERIEKAMDMSFRKLDILNKRLNDKERTEVKLLADQLDHFSGLQNTKLYERKNGDLTILYNNGTWEEKKKYEKDEKYNIPEGNSIIQIFRKNKEGGYDIFDVETRGIKDDGDFEFTGKEDKIGSVNNLKEANDWLEQKKKDIFNTKESDLFYRLKHSASAKSATVSSHQFKLDQKAYDELLKRSDNPFLSITSEDDILNLLNPKQKEYYLEWSKVLRDMNPFTESLALRDGKLYDKRNNYSPAIVKDMTRFAGKRNDNDLSMLVDRELHRGEAKTQTLSGSVHTRTGGLFYRDFDAQRAIKSYARSVFTDYYITPELRRQYSTLGIVSGEYAPKVDSPGYVLAMSLKQEMSDCLKAQLEHRSMFGEIRNAKLAQWFREATQAFKMQVIPSFVRPVREVSSNVVKISTYMHSEEFKKKGYTKEDIANFRQLSFEYSTQQSMIEHGSENPRYSIDGMDANQYGVFKRDWLNDIAKFVDRHLLGFGDRISGRQMEPAVVLTRFEELTGNKLDTQRMLTDADYRDENYLDLQKAFRYGDVRREEIFSPKNIYGRAVYFLRSGWSSNSSWARMQLGLNNFNATENVNFFNAFRDFTYNTNDGRASALKKMAGLELSNMLYTFTGQMQYNLVQYLIDKKDKDQVAMAKDLERMKDTYNIFTPKGRANVVANMLSNAVMLCTGKAGNGVRLVTGYALGMAFAELDKDPNISPETKKQLRVANTTWNDTAGKIFGRPINFTGAGDKVQTANELLDIIFPITANEVTAITEGAIMTADDLYHIKENVKNGTATLKDVHVLAATEWAMNIALMTRLRPIMAIDSKDMFHVADSEAKKEAKRLKMIDRNTERAIDEKETIGQYILDKKMRNVGLKENQIKEKIPVWERSYAIAQLYNPTDTLINDLISAKKDKDAKIAVLKGLFDKFEKGTDLDTRYDDFIEHYSQDEPTDITAISGRKVQSTYNLFSPLAKYIDLDGNEKTISPIVPEELIRGFYQTIFKENNN